MVNGASSSSSSPSEAFQTPEQAAEALRQLSIAQHSHAGVVESLAGGATNAGAQGGLIAGVLMAVLLQGQWDIGDTLKRYFKEHNAGDSLVARIVAGLDIYCTTFAALPPHFNTKITPAMQSAINAQFGTSCPFAQDSAHAGSRRVLQMLYASLLHHHDELAKVLPAHHQLRTTPIFEMNSETRDELKQHLGPEIGKRGDAAHANGALTATGLPSHTVFMSQVKEYHEIEIEYIAKVEKKVDEVKEDVDEIKGLLRKQNALLE